MNNHPKTFVWLTLLLTTLVCLATPARAEREMRVGVYNFRPLVFLGEDDQPRGLFIDLLERIAKDEKWRLRYVPGTWQESLTRLERGEIDLQVAIGYSEERAKRFDFCTETVALDWGVTYQRPGDNVATILDLHGARIAALQGSIYTSALRNLLEQFAVAAEVVEYPEYHDVFAAVERGVCRVGINANLAGAFIERDYRIVRTPIVFSPIRITFAVPKERNSVLLTTLDRNLSTLKRSPFWQEHLDRWLAPVEPSSQRLLYWGLAGAVGGGALLTVLLLRSRRRLRRESSALNAMTSRLQLSETRLATLTRLSPDAIFVQSDEQLVFVNDACIRLLGAADKEELLGESIYRIFHPDCHELIRMRIVQLHLGNDLTQSVEERVLRRDGGVVPVEVTAAVIADEFGTAIQVVLRDISERKAAEVELRRLKGYLAQIVDSMPSMLIGIDRRRHITQWNKTAETLTGIAAEEAVSHELGEVLPQFMPWIATMLDQMAPPQPATLEKILLGEGNTRQFYDLMLYPLVGGGDEGAVVRIENVTERARIQELMIQTEKMMSLGGLAAGIAHEINNPLGIISQASQNIERRLADDLPANATTAARCGISIEGLRRYLDERQIPLLLDGIRQSSARAAHIVGNLLQFSRQGGDAREEQSLIDLVERALELAGSDYDLKKAYDFRRIAVGRDYALHLPPVRVMTVEIEQVILNLLKNAAQALEGNPPERPPRIDVRLSHEEDWLTLEIADNGPGMSEEVRCRVFEPFFTTKAPGIGTGLGLSVSYMIVTHNHHGLLRVESAPGEGARFFMQLPLEIGRTQPQGDPHA